MNTRQVIFNALQTSLSGGIGRYCYELSKAIYEQYKIDFKIVIREEDKRLFNFANLSDLIIVQGIKNSKQRNYCEQFKLPKLIYKKYPDAIIHYPDTMAPLFAKNEIITTVHDLAFKSLKNAFTWKTVLWKNVITDLSMKKSDKVITITEFVKSEVLKYYPNVDNKINVIYNGFNDFSKDPIDLNNIKKNILNLKDSKYILTVSTISPRKNMDGLVKAFNLLRNKVSDYKLVIAGKNGWLYESVYKLIDKLELNDSVVFTGEVNDDELKVIGKGDKERIVFINSKAKLYLKKYLKEREHIKNPALFVASKYPHARLGNRSIEKEVNKIANMAKLNKAVYPHLIRHTTATLALKAGMSLTSIQHLLGHEDPSTTQIYAESDNESLKEEYKKFLIQ